MKHLLTGLIFLTWGCTAQAQTWETGLAINKTHLWQSDSYVDYTGRTEGLGVSIMARYQNPTFLLLLKNNEIGFEHSRGEVWIQQHTSPGGSGGDYTYLKYSTTSVTLNNYFANFGTLKKGFQVSMGLHYNYKINTLSDGYYMIREHKWDTLGHVWDATIEASSNQKYADEISELVSWYNSPGKPPIILSLESMIPFFKKRIINSSNLKLKKHIEDLITEITALQFV